MSEKYKIIQNASGNVELIADTQINSLNADKVVVFEKVSARLFGDIHKLLVLKKGSQVFLHGRILGDVKNEGGADMHATLINMSGQVLAQQSVPGNQDQVRLNFDMSVFANGVYSVIVEGSGEPKALKIIKSN